MRLPTIIGAWMDETPMPDAEKVDLRKKLNDDWVAIPYSEQTIEEYKKEGKPLTMKMQMKIWGENPYVRVIGCLVWLMGLRYIKELKNPTPNQDDEEL